MIHSHFRKCTRGREKTGRQDRVTARIGEKLYYF